MLTTMDFQVVDSGQIIATKPPVGQRVTINAGDCKGIPPKCPYL